MTTAREFSKPTAIACCAIGITDVLSNIDSVLEDVLSAINSGSGA
jgi:hypothetical protein